MADKEWVIKAKKDLGELDKDQLITKIIKQRKDTYSKTGKRNVATAKTHERRCKKLLTEWSGTEFRRRRVEGRGDDVSVVEGVADIIPVKGQIIFAIESKKGEKFSLNGLFDNIEGALFTKWWHQASYDAELLTKNTGQKRWPLLFFKPIPAWDWVAVPIECFKQEILKPKENNTSGNNCWFPHIKFERYESVGPIEHNISTSNKNPIMYGIKLEPCIMCRWQDFADGVDPSSIFVE